MWAAQVEGSSCAYDVRFSRLLFACDTSVKERVYSHAKRICMVLLLRLLGIAGGDKSRIESNSSHIFRGKRAVMIKGVLLMFTAPAR